MTARTCVGVRLGESPLLAPQSVSMARPLQLLSLLSRLGALPASPSAPVNARRFASRGASKAWTGQSQVHRDRAANRQASRYSDELSDEEAGLEDVEDKLQALVE